MFVVILCICGVISDIESARILGVFPTPSISHQVVFRPLVKELANRGHEVVVITADPAYPNGTGPPNLIEIDVHDISYNIWSKVTKTGTLNVGDPRVQIKLAFERLAIIFEEQVKSPQIQNLINDKKQKFDLLFTESCIRLSLSFSYIYNVPLIEISSFGGLYGTFDNILSPIHPLLYPIANQQKTNELSIWEKLTELYIYYGLSRTYDKLEKGENNLLKKLFGSQIPDLQELKKNVHMVFLNIHSVWDFNRPVSPNVVYLGGLHLQKKPVKNLPKNFFSIQNLINDKTQKFDLLFTESCIRLSLSFSYIYKVPLIEISSLGGVYGTFNDVVSPIHPLLYPIANQQKTNELSVWEKISELYIYNGISRAYEKLEELENNLLKKLFGSQIPDLQELKKNVHMVFLNIHSVWDFNRPVPPNVVYLGGLHLQKKPVKNLPQDIKSFLDSSTHGVIYMSFGTNVMPSSFPAEKIKKITQVFSKLPYDILWKWDSDKLPEHSKNVRISKWFPQSDLLRHPKVKLFITQGGLQSTDEALTAGVPLVVIPMLGDQWYNAEQYVFHGIGIKLLMEDLDEYTLKNAIESVIGNDSYRENVIKLRNIMRDQYQTPLEKAVWWTEYVLRHKGAVHLRARGAHMTWTEYYEVHLILVVLGQILILIVLAYVLVKFLISKLYNLSDKQKVN